jgi:hypothetical protein
MSDFFVALEIFLAATIFRSGLPYHVGCCVISLLLRGRPQMWATQLNQGPGFHPSYNIAFVCSFNGQIDLIFSDVFSTSTANS